MVPMLFEMDSIRARNCISNLERDHEIYRQNFSRANADLTNVWARGVSEKFTRSSKIPFDNLFAAMPRKRRKRTRNRKEERKEGRKKKRKKEERKEEKKNRKEDKMNNVAGL